MCVKPAPKSSRTHVLKPRPSARIVKVMHKPIFIGLTLGFLTAAGVAAAQYPAAPAPAYGSYPPPGGFPAPRARFGNQGVFAFSNDMNVNFSGYSQSIPNNTGDSPSGWTLTLKPSLDYFVIQGLSVGGFVQYTHTNASTPNQTSSGSTSSSADTFGIGPRVGYNIPISDALSWWPLLSLSFSTTSASGNNSQNAFTILAYAPFLYHPVSHFFMGLGPFVGTDLSANASQNGTSGPGTKTTVYGLQFTIGGWFLTG